MSSESRSQKVNGSPHQPLGFWYNAPVPAPPTSNVTFAQILVIMASSAPCTPALLAGRWLQVMQHIIVWRPSVISVIDGDIPMTSATFESMEDAMPLDMWSITVQSTPLPNQTFAALMREPTLTMTTSTPLWMTTEGMACIEPGARVYEGGNVTIFFLSHVFFLVSIVQHPYFHFAPSYKETDHYLLAFPSYSTSLVLPL